jgi:hypothetical protein
MVLFSDVIPFHQPASEVDYKHEIVKTLRHTFQALPVNEYLFAIFITPLSIKFLLLASGREPVIRAGVQVTKRGRQGTGLHVQPPTG